MGATCCGQAGMPGGEKTIYTAGGGGGGGGNSNSNNNAGQTHQRDQEIQSALDNLNNTANNNTLMNDTQQRFIEDTNSQKSFLLAGSLIQSNIHSMIQHHGTLDHDEFDKFKKQPFYGAEALGEFEFDFHLATLAKEEPSIVQAEQIGNEIKENMLLSLSHQKEVKELERKKSDLAVLRQETLQATTATDKDEFIKRASTQFDQQQNLIILQQQQLVHQQQQLEKQQQIIQQQKMLQQQMQLAQQAQIEAIKKVVVQSPVVAAAVLQAAPPAIAAAIATPGVAANSPKQQKLPVLQQSASAPSSPKGSRGRKEANGTNSNGNEVASSHNDTASVKSVDRPRSILRLKNNGTNNNSGSADLNSSFDSDVNSQTSKKKVKFKESTFKKQQQIKKKKY